MDDEWIDCKPTDGLHNERHPECQRCSRKSRQVCQIFAVYKGLKNPEDMVEDLEEFEPVILEDTLLDKIKKAKGGW